MRRFLAIALIAVFALRSMLAVGVMLQPASADGSVEVVICTGHGPEKINIDLGSPAPVPASDRYGTDVCPYAGVGAVTQVDDRLPRLADEVEYAAVVYRVTRELFRATPKPSNRTARGPPAILV